MPDRPRGRDHRELAHRRLLLRLSLRGLGGVIADLIESHRQVPEDQLVGRVETFLRNQSATSTYSPDDDELRAVLPKSPRIAGTSEDASAGSSRPSRTTYAGIPLPRLGPAFESHGRLPHRTPAAESLAQPWPVDKLAKRSSETHVHVFGNLTLITQLAQLLDLQLPWLGPKGKQAGLDKHDVLLMNREIQRMSSEGWTELLSTSERARSSTPSSPPRRARRAQGGTRHGWHAREGGLSEGPDRRRSSGARPGAQGASRTLGSSDLHRPRQRDLQLRRRMYTSPSGAGHAVRQANSERLGLLGAARTAHG